jgi:hypothetical protein
MALITSQEVATRLTAYLHHEWKLEELARVTYRTAIEGIRWMTC